MEYFITAQQTILRTSRFLSYQKVLNVPKTPFTISNSSLIASPIAPDGVAVHREVQSNRHQPDAASDRD